MPRLANDGAPRVVPKKKPRGAAASSGIAAA